MRQKESLALAREKTQEENRKDKSSATHSMAANRGGGNMSHDV